MMRAGPAILTICLAMTSVSANALTLYQDDFDSSSSPTFTTSFGSTEVVGPVPGNATNSLAFNSTGNSGSFFYDQIQYGIDVAGSPYENSNYRNFRVDFDITTSGLAGSVNQFAILFDTPSVRTLVFGGDGSISVANSGSPSQGAVGTYADGITQHVGMNFDIGNNQWDIYLDNTLLYSDSMNALFLRSIRLSHGARSAGLVDFDATTYIDNIVISAVPVPAAVWLFGTAILGLAGFGKSRKAA